MVMSANCIKAVTAAMAADPQPNQDQGHRQRNPAQDARPGAGAIKRAGAAFPGSAGDWGRHSRHAGHQAAAALKVRAKPSSSAAHSGDRDAVTDAEALGNLARKR